MSKIKNNSNIRKSSEKKPSLSINYNLDNSNINNNQKESDPLSKIKNFEKNLTKNFEYNYEKDHNSDIEQEDLEDENFLYDPLTDKPQIISRYKALQETIKEKTSQINLLRANLEENKKRQKEILDAIAKDQTAEVRDKKLIEFAKKNQEFKLQIEKFKLKEKEYEKKISELSHEIQNINLIHLNSEKNINSANNNNLNLNNMNFDTEGNNINTVSELKKKLKTSEAKIADIRNKLQLTKEENSKLNILIKREIGENIDLDKALKDKNYWKGRSEIIEGLKTKIKILESQFLTTNGNANITNNNNLSTISEEGKNSNNITNISNIFNIQNGKNKSISSTINNPSLFQEYKKEKEKLNFEIDKLKEENLKINTDYNRIKIRKEGLEKEVKSQKEDLTSKIKILLEKSDNDEKLIAALNRELEKKGRGLFNNANDENSLFNLQQEISKLRNEIKEKDIYINNINSIMMGEGNNNGNKEQHQNNLNNFSKIVIKLKELEEENKRLKNKSDDGKIYESLAKENAKMRLKVKELEDRLCEK